MLPLYIHRDSVIHRLPAALKIFGSLLVGTAIFFLTPVSLLAIAAVATGCLYVAARLPLKAIATALKPVLLVVAIILGLQLILAGPAEAARVVLRILAIVLLTSLVTLTTRLSDMLDVLSRAARPLRSFGVSPPRVALAASLAIRFIPTLLHDLGEIQQARLARQARGPSILGAGPLIVKILSMTDALGSAIAARGFESRKPSG